MRDEVERIPVVLAERRERIATAALQGLLAGPSRGPWKEAAEVAVILADELILQLDKEPQP